MSELLIVLGFGLGFLVGMGFGLGFLVGTWPQRAARHGGENPPPFVIRPPPSMP